MGNLFQELKRRKVFRVAAAYAIVAWLLIQVADVVLPNFNAPQWVIQTIILVLMLGLPVAVVLAWAFDITSEGIQQTKAPPLGEPTTMRKRDYVFSGLVLLLVGVVVMQQFDSYSGLRGEAGRDSLVDPTIDLAEPIPGFSGRAAIAVLPFLNLSNDPEQEYFADGITEDLITGLQSFQSFPIIARTSTFMYKGTSPDVREVAAALGAGYVMEGSVRKVDDDVRINVQLNDSQGLHVWAENFTFEYKDVLNIQSELVSKVLLAIEPELIITEADRTRFVRTQDMEAFDYFLRAATNTFAPFAYTDLNRREVTRERMEIAREYAMKAVELDPNFAGGCRILNHIDATMVINFAPLMSEEERQEAIDRSIEAGVRSLQLSPFEPSVCSCLSVMLAINGDLQGAMLLQEEALKQNPSNAAAHAWMAKMLQMQMSGNDERALEEILLAKRLSP